ncbi:pentapeptide repeat-containing protein [Flavilitoribacter nigricans]|uniref:Effector-associated domain-containing protein n=1 Tax=Flavilitoribacter nigricans (strain ATCC 23147 / DSM 23189 / NBRC 102662 / NCIMB 1420 / SS-2) TaxID=1122177 RepID=A0A2D0N2Y6_FLAN2|nr:pentapeptide repeat-containing protein [Flavilitoribacter nigricans]PHN02855.1 hypothetical protein CRP01_30215 [Flavilitoribacter nigricans DSM 23189 = NBRC 102662]
MDLSSICKAAENHIKNGRLEPAIEILLNFITEYRLHEGVPSYYRSVYDTLLLIQNQFSRANSNYELSLISQEEHNVKVSKLCAAVIRVNDQLQDEITDDKPPFYTSNFDNSIGLLLRPGEVVITLNLNEDFETYLDEDQRLLLEAIEKALNITEKEIREITRIEGSVILFLILQYEKAKVLEALFQTGALAELNIVEISFPQEEKKLISDPRVLDHLSAYLERKIHYLTDLIEVNLSGANLRGAYLRGAIMVGAYLIGVDLSGADLFGADLTGADLSGADLRGADLRTAELNNADLTGADLEATQLSGVDLENSKSLKDVKGLPEDVLQQLKQKRPDLFV